MEAIEFARHYTTIQDYEIDIIIHTKRTVIFSKDEPWKKKNSDTGLDITMGSYDGAKCCELVVVYMLSLLQPICGTTIGLYRDDGLGISKATPQETEHIKKHIYKIFKANDLKITIEANKKVVNFLDVTLDLNTGEYMPYMKPNNVLQYVHTNHPPVILKNIPKGVNKRLSEISSNEEVFNKAAPQYQKAHSCPILAILVGSTKRLAIRLRSQPLTEGLVTVTQLVFAEVISIQRLAEVISKKRFSGSHFQRNVELRFRRSDSIRSDGDGS